MKKGFTITLSLLLALLCIMLTAAFILDMPQDTVQQTVTETVSSVVSASSETETAAVSVSEEVSETEEPTAAYSQPEQPVPKKKNSVYLQQKADGKAVMNKIGEWVSDIETESDFSLTADTEHPYLIAVNRAANCVTVYIPDEEGQYTVPYRAMVCSTGGEKTPLGVWKTPTQEESSRIGVHDLWHLMDGQVYGQYVTRITPHKGILFHSVPYWTEGDKSSLEYEEYNKLGTFASLGCIRLAAADSKWIFDYCPYGTTVVIYDDENYAGPLGKPESIRIDTENELLRGWDPTDPDENNPWGEQWKNGTAIYYAGPKTFD